MLQEVGVLSYSGYALSKGHSMAMRCSSRTIDDLRASFRVLSVSSTTVLE